MNYLFFDLEFASCKGGYHKVCEFGYALTDESFSLIERGNFLINPLIGRGEWDFFALRKIIKRKVSDFTSEPPFADRIDLIRALFDKAAYAFGHSTVGDVQALNQECKRFSLPALSFSFFDLAEFYKKHTQSKNQRALTAILSDLSVAGDENAHNAESDAFNTMLGVREILKRENETAFAEDPIEAFEVFLSKYGIAPRKSEAISPEPHRKRSRSGSRRRQGERRTAAAKQSAE